MLIYTFDQIIGQKNTKEWVQSKLEQDRVPHVLMFVGAPGIGKTSLAKILACELACKDSPERLDEVKEKVIKDNQSTDCVRLYNMSTLKGDDAVREVTSDLTVGLSSTGRKVIIMDEAHGMSNEAQDSLLVRFESLDKDVYIILCSTEINYRDAFLSRCIIRNFKSPSQSELKQLILQIIQELGLKFSISANMAIQFIMSSCNNEPRRIINLLLALDNTREVTKDDLIDFNMAADDKVCYRLIQYLYNGNIVDGLQFISDVKDGFFKNSMNLYLEMVKVALGSQSYMISREISMQISDLVMANGTDKLLSFVSSLCTRQNPSKHYVSGVFIKLSIDIRKIPKYNDDVQISNIQIMNNTEQTEHAEIGQQASAITLEELFANADVVGEDS